MDMNDIELFKFSVGATDYKYYTDEREGLYTSGWEPEIIERSKVTLAQDQSKNQITVRMPADNPVAQLFISAAPRPEAELTIYEADASDIAGTIEQVWEGMVSTVKLRGRIAELPCRPEAAQGERSIPRNKFSRNCRHALYSRSCGVDKSTMADPGTVEAIDEEALTVDVQLAQVIRDLGFKAGVLELDGVFVPILESSNVGNIGQFQFRIASWLSGLSVGDSIVAYPGCQHNMSDCSLFGDVENGGNIANFGGFPQLPKVSQSDLPTS